MNIIYYAQGGASFITKKEAVKKKIVFASTQGPHEQNGVRVS